MERSALDQTIDLLTQHSRIVLAVPASPSTDAVTSMVALSLALESIGKTTWMVSASHVPTILQFLPGTSQIHDRIERTTDMVVDLPTGSARVADLRWEQTHQGVRMILSPEKGKTFSDVIPVVRTGLYPWEVIVTIGSPDLHHLGAPFTDHATFFYDTPIINIDFGTANEFFGTVNLVPATAGTLAEVIHELLMALGGVNVITPEVATNLYAGILTGTRSFQAPHTSPHAFAVAASLLEQQADRQTVTRHLFKTHALPELRLAGRSLARLKELNDVALWSVLQEKDFRESGATPDDLPRVFQDIIESAGERLPMILAFERTPKTLEALVFLGRVSTEDKERIRVQTNGTILGNFLLVSFGALTPGGAEDAIRERILPHLPETNR